MPTIENTVLINAPLETVYALAKDVEAFPEFMPDVESLVVKERSEDGSRTVTDWVGVAAKIKVRWSEEDIWDDAAHTCVFKQTAGDYEHYDGSWTFSQEGAATRFHSVIDYEIEIPLVGPLVKSLIAKLMKDNTQKILDAIKTKAETRPS